MNLIVCNKCGKEIERSGDIYVEDMAVIKKQWGYFSKKDGIRQSFCLCEACFDAFADSFKIPIKEETVTELL